MDEMNSFANQNTYVVSDVCKILKRIIDSEEMLSNIMISGEVTNFKFSGSHAYFTLKDEFGQMFCTYFNAKVKSSAYIPKNGEKVLVRATPDFYVAGGSLSLKVTIVTPQGLGALHLQLEELKAKLIKNGIFDEAHKKPIPKVSKRIGVITSPTGAVISDIINVSTRRNPFVDIVLFPVKVQGVGADKEIASAIRKLDAAKIVDVIIVGRGGGSVEDLLAFYSEEVCIAVYDCKTPIISAVGHETDISFCDFAADLRAPTPSAAAELAVYDFYSAKATFDVLRKQMQNKVYNVFKLKSSQLKADTSALAFSGNNTVSICEKKLVNIRNSFKLKVNNTISKIDASSVNVKNNTSSITSKIKNIYSFKREIILRLKENLDGKSPLRLLDFGYAKVSINGKKITSISEVSVDDEVNTYLLGGVITSKVLKKNINKETV